jgi:hypothetical protein
MRKVLPAVLAATLGMQATAAVHAVLPGCCNSFASLTVMQPATGAIALSYNAGAVGTSLYGTSGIGFVLTKGGGAAILSSTYPTPGASQAYVVTVLNLSTGTISAPLTIPGIAYAIASNPQSGAIYVGYAHSDNYVEVINPATLAVLGNFKVSATAGPITVSPDGQTIYVPSSGGINALKASNLQSIGTAALASPARAMAVSTDGSTLYAGYGSHGLAFVDTATLQVTSSISNAALDDLLALALSPDDSQLYISAGTSLSVLQTANQSLSTVALPVVGDSMAVAPSGSVYLGETGSNGTPEVAVFDPVSQSVAATYPVPGTGSLALSSDGNILYHLNYYAPAVSITGAVPSQTVAGSGITGSSPGYGAYDAKDDLLLIPDYLGNVNVLDPNTLQFKGVVYISTPVNYVVYANMGYAITGVGSPPNMSIVQFDPVNLQVTGTVQIPYPANDYDGYYTQPAAIGDFLYVPFNFYNANATERAPAASGGVNYGIAVLDTQTMSIAVWPFNVSAILGFTIARGSRKGYLSVQAGLGAYEMIEIDLGSGHIVKATELGIAGSLASSADGSTIYLAGQFASSTGYGALYAVDAQTLAISNSTPSLYLEDLSITPDGQYLYGPTGTGSGGAVDIVSTGSLQLAGRISSAGVPAHVIFAGR